MSSSHDRMEPPGIGRVFVGTRACMHGGESHCIPDRKIRVPVSIRYPFWPHHLALPNKKGWVKNSPWFRRPCTDSETDSEQQQGTQLVNSEGVPRGQVLRKYRCFWGSSCIDLVIRKKEIIRGVFR